MAGLLGLAPDDWVPTKIMSDLQYGLLDRQVVTDRRSQSATNSPSTRGWWSNLKTNNSTPQLREHSDGWSANLRNDSMKMLRFKHTDRKAIRLFHRAHTTFHSRLSQPCPFMIRSLVCDCPGPNHSEINETHAVVNLRVKTLLEAQPATGSWSGFSNEFGVLLPSHNNLFWTMLSRPCLDQLMETDDFLLFQRQS
jgi:hypothetical protein